MANGNQGFTTFLSSSYQSVITFFGFYVINQDEVGVLLTFGRFTKNVGPGLGFALPIIQSVRKTKASLQTIDLPHQEIVLSGNISVTIAGRVNFRVANPKRAILDVKDYQYSMHMMALTTISDVLGTKTIEEVRAGKNNIAQEIENIVSKSAEKWGLSDVDIRLTDAKIDESLLRAMMRETEAEKEANAIKIKAESDKAVSKVFAEAAHMLAQAPGAMTLRVLQTINDISNNKSTIVIPIPVEFLSMLGKTGQEVSQFGGGPETPVPPVPKKAKLVREGNEIKAHCPHCGRRYKVTNILGDLSIDQDKSIPGIQVNCVVCKSMFTLPDVA